MENDSAFKPISYCFAIAAAASPPTPVQLSATVGGGSPSVGSEITAKIYNSGTVVVFMAYSSTAAQATANCVAPTPGSPTQTLAIAPGEDGTFTVPPGQFWTATAASASTVYVQTGYGI